MKIKNNIQLTGFRNLLIISIGATVCSNEKKKVHLYFETFTLYFVPKYYLLVPPEVLVPGIQASHISAVVLPD